MEVLAIGALLLILVATSAAALASYTDLKKEIFLEYAFDVEKLLDWAPHTRLTGSGAHRVIEYIFDKLSFEAAACGGDRRVEEVVIIQPLHSEAFFDPYEISDVLPSSDGFSFRLFGNLDLELPASVCDPTALALTINTTAVGNTPGRKRICNGGPDASETMTIQVPVHAKYPAPAGWTKEERSSLVSSLWANSFAGMVVLHIEPPLVLARCASGADGSGKDVLDWAESKQVLSWRALGHWQPRGGGSGSADEALGVRWEMPAGSMIHASLVAWGTFAVSLGSGAYIAWHLWRLPLS